MAEKVASIIVRQRKSNYPSSTPTVIITLTNHIGPKSKQTTFNHDEELIQQNFAFRNPLIEYISKKANHQFRKKLRQTCKYFHKNNPMVIVDNFYYGYDDSLPERVALGKYDLSILNFDEMKGIIDVVIEEIHCHFYDKIILTKIRRCEAKLIEISYFGEISMDEFNFFTQSGLVKFWYLDDTTIKDVNGGILSFEDLLANLPLAESIVAYVHDISHEINPKIIKSHKKIDSMSIYFDGKVNIDHFFELFQQVLVSNSKVYVYFPMTVGLSFLKDMKDKMNTWIPEDEKLLFEISFIVFH